MSKLCSITTTVLPTATNLLRTEIKFSRSAKCNPVVGSSRIYKVLPVDLLESSVANLTLWASPPDKVGAGCPNLI